MPSQPKGARWGLNALFGKPKYSSGKGCKIFFLGPALLAVGGALAVWRVAESSGVL